MRRRGAVAVTVVAALLFAAQAASAYISPTSGEAQADVAAGGSANVVTVVEGSGLYPNKAATATIDIANPGAAAVRVTSISQGASLLVGGCGARAVTSVGLARAAGVIQVDGATVRIPPGGVGRYRIGLFMWPTAESACIGQRFDVPVTVVTEAIP